VANLGGGGVQPSVTVLHRPTLTELATVPLPGPARAIALNSDARQVYVAGDRGVHIVNTGTLSVERTIPAGAGRGPFAIAAAPGTARQVYVGDRLTGDVTRFV
jgi:DNA-binding beta-propeller fold protein YncE